MIKYILFLLVFSVAIGCNNKKSDSDTSADSTIVSSSDTSKETDIQIIDSNSNAISKKTAKFICPNCGEKSLANEAIDCKTCSMELIENPYFVKTDSVNQMTKKLR